MEYEMGTTYSVNQFDEVVPCYDGRTSNSTTDRRYTTDFEKQLLEEIKELKIELEETKANPVENRVSQPSEPTFGQWTLTTDRMPLHSGFYLTVDINENDEPFIMIYPYDEIDKTFVDMAQYPNKDVIKWMPLPKP